jgi:hypothetical protein
MARLGGWQCVSRLFNCLESAGHLSPRSIKAEEMPSALLLAQAALLSARKNLRRKAALWYLFAANRLEMCGNVRTFLYFEHSCPNLMSRRNPLPCISFAVHTNFTR